MEEVVQRNFYRVERTLPEENRYVTRNVGHGLVLSPIAFESVYDALGVYRSAKRQQQEKELRVLELIARKIPVVTDEFDHYIIEFYMPPQGKPRKSFEYRPRDEVGTAINRPSNPVKEATLYGVEISTIIRPFEESLRKIKH